MIKQFDEFAELLLSNSWTFAKTMPKNPHYYTLKKNWGNPEEFERCVMFIRKHGYVVQYGGRNYTCFDINGQKYWSMGAPLDKTILINRSKVVHFSPYDDIAEKYHSLFKDEEAIKENREVMEFVNYKAGQSVLDIGCGDGLFLDLVNPELRDYIGLDPSSKMLDALFDLHGGLSGPYLFICSQFERFYCKDKFDLIISLFGSFSYVSPDQLERIPDMLTEGGKALLMVYSDEYHPVTYEKTGIEMSHFTAKDYTTSIHWNRFEYGNYVFLEYVK